MGWLFKSGVSRKDLIAENTKSWERTKEDGTTVASVCLAHCYRGGVFSGVLWTVWERSFIKDGQQVEQPQRWIVCDLLRYVEGEWGYDVDGTDRDEYEQDENCDHFIESTWEHE